MSQAGSPSPPRLLLALLPAALIYGVLSGLRWPSVYAFTHWIIDYHFGFGKRGLIGTLLALIDRPPYHYATLAWMAFALMAAWLAALLWLGLPALRRDAGVAGAFLLFFLSAGFASLVQDVGRGEHFGLLLALPCLALPARWPYLLLRPLLLLVAALMHEANFVLFAPIVAFDVFLARRPQGVPRAALTAAATLAPLLPLVIWLGNHKTACDTTHATGYFAQQAADFRPWFYAVATLCLNGAENWRHAHEVFGWFEIAPTLFWLSALATLPGTLLSFSMVCRVLRGDTLAEFAALATIFAPLSMLLVATDIVRFATLIQLTALLTLLVAIRRLGLPPQGTLPEPRDVAVLAAVAALQLGTSLPLNDGSEMMKYPFTPLVKHLEDALHGRTPFVVVPSD